MNNKKQHITYLRKDPIGELCFIVNKIIDIAYCIVPKFICIAKFRCSGIKYGTGIRIRGCMKAYRFQCSSITIGKNCTFNSSSRFNVRGLNHACILQTGQPEAIIQIGNECGFSGVSIVADKKVIIGNHVMIGANTLIGDRDDHPERLGTKPQPIHIGDHVFIGMNCIVMKGVNIGRNSIIGAGSIVTKDIPANCIAAGVPCKIIRKIENNHTPNGVQFSKV